VKTIARIIETCRFIVEGRAKGLIITSVSGEGANYLDADNAIKRIAELLALCETEKYLVLDALQTLRALEAKGG
jgi:hypothetical protein